MMDVVKFGAGENKKVIAGMGNFSQNIRGFFSLAREVDPGLKKLGFAKKLGVTRNTLNRYFNEPVNDEAVPVQVLERVAENMLKNFGVEVKPAALAQENLEPVFDEYRRKLRADMVGDDEYRLGLGELVKEVTRLCGGISHKKWEEINREMFSGDAVYKITDKTLGKLELYGLPPEMLTILEPFKGVGIATLAAFRGRVLEAFGGNDARVGIGEETVMLSDLVIRYADKDSPYLFTSVWLWRFMNGEFKNIGIGKIVGLALTLGAAPEYFLRIAGLLPRFITVNDNRITFSVSDEYLDRQGLSIGEMTVEIRKLLNERFPGFLKEG